MKDDMIIPETDMENGSENASPEYAGPDDTGSAENGQADTGSDGKTSDTRSALPRRYRLYDKIAENVSLRSINMVILITSALIIILLVYGIVTGTPQ